MRKRLRLRVLAAELCIYAAFALLIEESALACIVLVLPTIVLASLSTYQWWAADSLARFLEGEETGWMLDDSESPETALRALRESATILLLVAIAFLLLAMHRLMSSF